MTREEAKHIVDVAFSVPQAVRRDGEDRTYHEDEIREAKNMAIQALSQEPCDECRNKRTSICGNCKEYDEFEEIDFVQEHKKIPVTLDLTPCDDAISRQAVLNAIEHEDKWLLAAKGHNGLTEIAFSGLKARVDAFCYYRQVQGGQGMRCKCGCMMLWHSDYVNGIFVSWYTCPSCGYDTRNQQYTWSDRTYKESEE